MGQGRRLIDGLTEKRIVRKKMDKSFFDETKKNIVNYSNPYSDPKINFG